MPRLADHGSEVKTRRRNDHLVNEFLAHKRAESTRIANFLELTDRQSLLDRSPGTRVAANGADNSLRSGSASYNQNVPGPIQSTHNGGQDSSASRQRTE